MQAFLTILAILFLLRVIWRSLVDTHKAAKRSDKYRYSWLPLLLLATGAAAQVDTARTIDRSFYEPDADWHELDDIPDYMNDANWTGVFVRYRHNDTMRHERVQMHITKESLEICYGVPLDCDMYEITSYGHHYSELNNGGHLVVTRRPTGEPTEVHYHFDNSAWVFRY